MSKRKILLIIFFMAVAVIGLVGLQFYWIKGALFVQEEYFNQNVSRAMNEVVSKLDRMESADLLLKRLKQTAPKTHLHQKHKIQFTHKGNSINGSIEISTEDTSNSNETTHKFTFNQ